MDDLQGNQPPRWRELLDHRGAVIVLACGVLVGAVNIYLASSLLPTAVAELGGTGFYAWNMTIYLVSCLGLRRRRVECSWRFCWSWDSSRMSGAANCGCFRGRPSCNRTMRRSGW
jgi:hypothetical protein